MTLPYRLIIATLILFASCKSGKTPATGAATAKTPAKDTASDIDDAGYPTRYVEHARLDMPDHIIALTSRFAVVNGKVDEECHFDASSNYFVLSFKS